MISEMYYLNEIVFGWGARERISDILSRLQVDRPLFVTDEGLLNSGLLKKIPAAEHVFSSVPTNPTEASVLAGLEMYREWKCDGVVAVGGGSPIDCAKCISLLVTHAPPLEKYAVIRGGLPLISSEKPPVIVLPTTSGTGSEVGRAALITFPNGEKLGIISRHMIPTVAVCDPELTIDLPPRLTAATGFDAISHCVETYSSPKFNPVADAIALDGLHRAWINLPLAYRGPQDREARSNMMMAALQGGLCFQKGLGLIHSLSHPLGGVSHLRLHHGTLNAVLLPHVLRFNSRECPEKMKSMAMAIGVHGGADVLAEACTSMMKELDLPLRLRDMGITQNDLDTIPAAAMHDHSTPTNPRMLTLADCHAVLASAW
ncbi:MAG: iron-containing alcohol dehydrogenase [Planctomycetota bacterium]|nr:iron-containing alcohol dehydrogenase [Planctomycetota bacterium]MDA1213293.1 iron-containing alcohol dehydrogenase [Planctomycetota bacterium]